MMREILFQGKRTDNGEWIEGYYVHLRDSRGRESHRIYTGYAETDCGDFYPDWFEVDPDTVGRYVGMPDKNGKRIFEGDVVTFETTAYSFKPCVVAWSFTKMRFVASGREANYPMDIDFKYEIIGNIHDNPELLEEK